MGEIVLAKETGKMCGYQCSRQVHFGAYDSRISLRPD